MRNRVILTAASVIFITTLAISAFVPSPAAAEPRCENWDVSQRWGANQENGFFMEFDLTQTGTKLSGTGYSCSGIWFECEKYARRYPVEGSLVGNSIKLDTGWGGVYIGKIDDTGRIDGTTYDKKDSTSSSKWFSGRRMECLSSTVTQETQSKEKKGLSLGRVQQTEKKGLALGRVQQTDPKLEQPDPPICDKARSARARNSPAAPNLEAQCRAAGGKVESPKVLGRVTLPPKLVSVTVTPSTIRASGSSTATVTLDEVAPPRGITVFLASSDPERVSIPGSIIVPAGQKSGSIVLRADNKLLDGQVQITASLQSGAFQADAIAKSTVMATLTIQVSVDSPSPTESKKALGRARTPDPKIEQPDPPICAIARSARARNSPAAPNLEAQCRAAGGTP